SLVAARAGARVVGTDVDGRALRFAALNALLNGVSAAFFEGDLFAGVDDRFNAVALNAPLLRAPVAGEAPLYLRSPRGESLATDFLRGAPGRTARGGEVLCHVQLTGAVDEAVGAAGLPRAP